MNIINTYVKYIAWLVALTIPLGSQADSSGGFVNLQLGMSTSHLVRPSPNNPHLVTPGKGFSQRIGLGYQFNDFFSTEIGFSNYPKEALIADPQQSYTKNSFDWIFKGIYPVDENFMLYGNFGLGLTFLDTTSNVKKARPQPLFGLGVGSYISDQVVLTLGWNRMVKVKNNNPTTIDIVALGLELHF